MHFDISGERYTVVIASRPLIVNKQPAKAKIEHGSLRILISDQLPRHQRKLELLHELRHAWINAYGPASNSEADANQAAEMMSVVMEQYLAQGGDATLEALNPDPVQSAHREPSGVMGSFFRECGSCTSRIASGSIEDSEPAWNEDASGWVMDRRMPCDACGSITVWRELCTAEGMPLGTILPHPKPRVLTSAR
jgi:hypothetical protein